MHELHVLRVFTDGARGRGNPLGVFVKGAEVAPEERQGIAAELGYSETVFVEDAGTGELRIFTPAVELPLAGHPLVGTAWLLRSQGHEVPALRPPAGEVETWSHENMSWIRGRPEWAPRFELQQVDSPAEVDAHPGAGQDGLLDVWAWEDESAGKVRARVFAPAVGVPEDPATGAAAMLLAAHIGRPITIRQGEGSIILARPGPDGTVEIGGRVVLDEVREWPVR